MAQLHKIIIMYCKVLMHRVLYADFMNLFMHITVHVMHNMYTQRGDSSHMSVASLTG